MTITPSLISELRKTTGCGIMDCKKALQEANGNIPAAVEILRKKGMAKAAKKASRIASEGTIRILLGADEKQAVMLEINCETDFVARDESFLAFTDLVAKAALAGQISDLNKLNGLIAQGTQTIEDLRQALVAKLGENISIRRLKFIKTQHQLGTYLHGNRIGVIVILSGGDETLSKDIAMQIAATNPLVISPDQVPQDKIAQEKEIYMAQADKSGKPADIIEKMVQGRIKKFLDEISLIGQPFVKDPKKTVGELLKSKKATVLEFVRYELGEGIEKTESNFAEEVKALSK
ncbi:MAG: elongation factor Ts [Gammaproteobacteria bacterium]|nr:elongation factor Ts [Gammaproteobacteria bacterium]